MNKELDKYYTERFDMMASQGWKDLIEDIDEMIKSNDVKLNNASKKYLI